MIVIILNSGIGKRLGKLTKDQPKCLVKIASNETILGRQMRLLTKKGLTKFIITTGPFLSKITDYLTLNYPKLEINYFHNSKYATTNYIYSLDLIDREIIDDDVLLLHGDLLFDELILDKIMAKSNGNYVLVDKEAPVPEKDFKGKIINDRVIEIGVNVFGKDCFLLMPFYRLTKTTFLKWMDQIALFVKDGRTSVYAENALNEISDKLHIRPLYFHDELCMEIDTEDDLLLAQELIQRLNR